MIWQPTTSSRRWRRTGGSKLHTGPGGDKYRLISEINMIPFIDVSLVLLIIFMVMTPFLMKSQIKVNLPGSSSAQQITQDDKTVDIQVQADGAIFMDGKKVAAKDLAPTSNTC